MNKYPMMDESVDIERLETIGGKAYILEEILRRWPDAPIPKFEVPDNGLNNFGTGFYRASSILDVFGGFGLTDSVLVNTSRDSKAAYCMIIDPKREFYKYADSVNISPKRPRLMIQEFVNPAKWALIMEHPNKKNLLLINYSGRPSGDIRTVQSKIIGNDNSKTFYYDGKIHAVDHNDYEYSYGLEKGIEQYFKLRDLGIINNEWVCIAELGIFSSESIIYQWSPIKKRVDNVHSSVSPLIMGSLDKTVLPVINIDTHPHSITRDLQTSGTEISVFFNEFLKEINEDRLTMKNIFINDPNFLIREYINSIEKKYSDGYILLSHGWNSGNIPFDISMKNAKSIIIGTHREGLGMLNHDISRMIYKTPCLILGDVDIPHLGGSLLEFSCDGKNYEIKRI
ncbi:MAG: hypothetical protein ACP5NV_05430 [Candidatus Woesearchaeota archaeon]